MIIFQETLMIEDCILIWNKSYGMEFDVYLGLKI